ncbi:MAG: HlyD family efflux transporter periplasmic adaptor subunit [Prolixibacteraceae bacterium]|jgi:multidrug efflux pump subunit AcrA (membrane-fusion protein)|nr:HlyD family efflux transporter periplasmic adaptor subunit [Prolixibacteraceae bacterium]
MKLTKSNKTLIIGTALCVVLLVVGWLYFRKQVAGIYRVKTENFEAIITCKGEIQSEKAVLINLPDIFGNRTLELWDMQIKDLIPEGSIVKKGDYVALLDQGRIKQLKENNGEYLKKMLFNFSDSKIDSAVDLVALRNGIDQFRYDLNNRKIELEQSAYESPAFQRKAQMAYERIVRQMDARVRAYLMTQKTLRIQVSRVEDKVKELTLKDKNYQIALDAARITAPKDGMLIYGRTFGRGGSRKLTVGSYISMQSPVIATLPDLSVLASETYVEEIYISKIKIGDSVRVYIDALKNQLKVGVISNISNVGQEMSGFESKVFKVIIRISSDNKRIKPAMTTNNEIIISKEPNVLVIPRSSLFSDGPDQFVYLKEFGRVSTRNVECGNQNEKFVVIKSGLKEGDKILLNKPLN